MELEQNVESGNRTSGYAHEAELVWWGALIFPYSQLLPRLLKYSLFPLCSKAENHLQHWRKDRWNNCSFCLFCSWQQGKSKLWGGKKRNKYISAKMRFVLLASGLSRAHSIFFRGIMTAVKITTWVSGNSKLSHMKWPEEIFCRWRLLASCPKTSQDLKVQADFLKWQDINLCLKGNRNESTSSAIGKSFIVSYRVQPNKIKCLFFSLLRAMPLVDKGR